MPFKPNYGSRRADGQRAQEEKRDAKEQARQGRGLQAMSEARRAAAVEKAEKLLSPKPPQPTYAEEAALLEQQRRAQDEKTARLRALRLAKEAAEAQGQSRQKV
jgi:hypothetical protein